MIVSLLPATLFAAAPQVEAPVDALRWERRVLLVFAGGSRDPDLAVQRAAVEDERAAFRDRDLMIVEVVGDSVSGVRDYAPRLRSRYGVGQSAFAAFLLGKDGDAKLRSRTPIAAETLFATIDAMPMRIREAASNAPRRK